MYIIYWSESEWRFCNLWAGPSPWIDKQYIMLASRQTHFLSGPQFPSKSQGITGLCAVLEHNAWAQEKWVYGIKKSLNAQSYTIIIKEPCTCC